LLRTIDLKLIESLDVQGFSYSLGDILVSFGTILKNNSLTKEVLLRIELKSLINTVNFEDKFYQKLIKDIFTILGPKIGQTFSSPEHLEKLTHFLKKEADSSVTMGKTNKLLFDQNSIAMMYCLLFFNWS
jgi:hypothetical protein